MYCIIKGGIKNSKVNKYLSTIFYILVSSSLSALKAFQQHYIAKKQDIGSIIGKIKRLLIGVSNQQKKSFENQFF